MAWKEIGARSTLDPVAAWKMRFLRKRKNSDIHLYSVVEFVRAGRSDQTTFEEVTDALVKKGFTVVEEEGEKYINCSPYLSYDYDDNRYTDEEAKLFHYKRCAFCDSPVYGDAYCGEVDFDATDCFISRIDDVTVYCNADCFQNGLHHGNDRD